MCDDAARAPAAVRPALTAMIGFWRVTRRASSVNFRGLPNDSRYIRIAWTSALCSQYSRRSLPETSVLLPIDTNIATPIPDSAASARIASPSAPDCETNPTLPRDGTVAANVAFNRIDGFGVDHAHAVRPDHAHPVAPHEVVQTPLEVCAFRADLAKAGGHDHDASDPFAPAGLDRVQDVLARNDDDRQIDRPRHVGDRPIRRHRVHDVGVRVHRIDGTLEAELHEVVQDLVADRAPLLEAPMTATERGRNT